MKDNTTKERVSVPIYRQLRTKLIASFMVPVLCIIVLGLVSYQKASDAVISSYEESVNETLSMANQYISLVINTVRASYNTYISDADLRNYFKGLLNDKEAGAVESSFKNIIGQEINTSSLVKDIYFISDDMPSITSTVTTTDALLSAYAQTEEGAQVEDQRFNYHIFGNLCDADAALGTDSSQYSFRIAKYLSGSKGIMLVDLNRDIIMNSLATLEAGDGSYVALITPDGTEFYSDGTSARNSVFATSDFYADAVESEESGMEYVTYAGKKYLFLYSPLAGQSVMICMLIPQDTIQAQTSGIKTVAVVLVIFAVVIAMLLGYILSAHINSNIYHILKQLKIVSGGDLTAHLQSKGKDEFKLLAEGVNSMADNMKTLITNVTQASNSLNKAAEHVSTSSETFVRTSEDIRNAISEIDSGVTQLDANSADCLTQMDTLSGKISEVTEDTKGVIDLTQSAGDSINEGISSMTVLTDSAKKTSEITNQVITAIETLSDKSRSIGQIVESINSIARETNLLSLNASIEAARAGESGRGFAVVAEQIRQLADQSAQSAGQIGVIIDDIVKTTTNVVEIAKEAEASVEFQEQAVSRTTESFVTMDKQIHTLLDSISTISESIQNMEGARSTTLNAIESISSISAETSAGASNVERTVTAQRDAIQTLDDAAGILQERAGELTGLLQQFII